MKIGQPDREVWIEEPESIPAPPEEVPAYAPAPPEPEKAPV